MIGWHKDWHAIAQALGLDDGRREDRQAGLCDLISAHYPQIDYDRIVVDCACGWREFPRKGTWVAHLAEMIDNALHEQWS